MSWSQTDQPSMLLHELAHAWHHQVLGEDIEVTVAYDAAVESQAYESVRRANGERVRHYALTNEREYFAELSEAYFGVNDFYPFTREDLAAFDALGFELVRDKWSVAPD